jgi:ribose/xylose/arabinose/galactoside ABC-type transport system permease subunit
MWYSSYYLSLSSYGCFASHWRRIFNAIYSCCNIGGVSLYGGEGTIGGVFIGIFILAAITNVLTVAGVPPTVDKAF